MEDFVQRLSHDALNTSADTPLQKHIDSVVCGFRDADSNGSNAGHEVIEVIRQSFRRMRPETKFQTLREYLDFRHDNVGAE